MPKPHKRKSYKRSYKAYRANKTQDEERAQTTTEWLIIFVSILFIALLYFALTNGIPETAASGESRADKAYWESSSEVSITNWAIDKDGFVIFTLKDSKQVSIDIFSFTINGQEVLAQDIFLKPEQEATVTSYIHVSNAKDFSPYSYNLSIKYKNLVTNTITDYQGDRPLRGKYASDIIVLTEIPYTGTPCQSSMVLICHNPTNTSSKQSLCVENASQYLGQGDTLGVCTFCSLSTIGNLTYYLPFKPSTSGRFPAKGNATESVTLTSAARTSNGYLYINLTFYNLPPSCRKVGLKMDFTDLDLQGDVIVSGSNRATLFETFALMDKFGSVLAVLNRSYPDDDDFVWTYNLSDALFDGTTLNLDTYFTAALNLTQGNSLTVGNGVEKVGNVRICGEA